MKAIEANRLKKIEAHNRKLKEIVADLSRLDALNGTLPENDKTHVEVNKLYSHNCWYR